MLERARETYGHAAELAGEDDEVVLADGQNVHHVAVLELGDVRGEVLAQQLPRRPDVDRNAPLQPLHEAARVAALGEEEVEAVRLRLNVLRLAVHVRLDDLLLQEVERSLVLHLGMSDRVDNHLLSQLHDGFARVLDRLHDTVFTRLRFHDKAHNEGLLEDHTERLLLHRQVQLDSLRVRLRPNELGIDQLHLLQAYRYIPR